MWMSATGYAAGLGLFLIPFLMGWMGAGDTKLLAAIGAAVGAKGVFSVMILTTLAGGVYGIMVFAHNLLLPKIVFLGMYAKAHNISFLPDVISTAYFRANPKPKICYGVALAAGTLWYLWGVWSGTEIVKIF
jgi:prepilin peptidase CpaA